MGRPVFSVTSSSRPRALSASQRGAVLRHCHTMAFATGRPVLRSHTIVVSRWFVMPIAMSWRGLISVDSSKSSTVSITESKISLGLCSTQPGWGYIWVISWYACQTTRPEPSTSRAVVPVVP